MNPEKSIGDFSQKSFDAQEGILKAAERLMEPKERIQSIVESCEENQLAIQEAYKFATFPCPMNDSLAIQAVKEISKDWKCFTIATNMAKAYSAFSVNCAAWENIASNTQKVQEAYNTVSSLTLDKALLNLMPMYSAAVNEIVTSPALKWLKSVNFVPYMKMLDDIHLREELMHEYHRKLEDVILVALYKCRWFPYASWVADRSLMRMICRVIGSSRVGSKRCEKRVDKLIFDYYTSTQLRALKQAWRKLELESYVKKILGQAVEAHIRGEYALSIAVLSTMWEGMILEKLHITERCGQKKTGMMLNALIAENGLKPIFGEFYNKLIVSDCNTKEDVIDGVPNRNGVAHSKYKKYPDKKASLNAILITDFILRLDPKQEMEESLDGQA